MCGLRKLFLFMRSRMATDFIRPVSTSVDCRLYTLVLAIHGVCTGSTGAAIRHLRPLVRQCSILQHCGHRVTRSSAIPRSGPIGRRRMSSILIVCQVIKLGKSPTRTRGICCRDSRRSLGSPSRVPILTTASPQCSVNKGGNRTKTALNCISDRTLQLCRTFQS